MSLTPEQLEIRRTRIGSSEIGVVLGVDPHRTILDLFASKTLPEEPREGTPQMVWGGEVEASILRWYAAHRDISLRNPGTLIHPTRDLLCATPDALAIEDECTRVVEAKNVGGYNARQWGDEDDEIPTHYAAQVTWEIGISRACAHAAGAEVHEVGHLVATIAGEPPRIYPVRFDPDVFGVLADRAEKFLRDHVHKGIPPEGWEQDRGALDYVARRWRKATGPLIQPTPEIETAVALYRSLLASSKALEEERDAAKARLCSLIGDAAGIEGLATWASVAEGRAQVTDWRALAEELGADADAIARHTQERVVRKGYRALKLKKIQAEAKEAA